MKPKQNGAARPIRGGRLGDLLQPLAQAARTRATVKAADGATADVQDLAMQRRHMVAAFCRLFAQRTTDGAVGGGPASPPSAATEGAGPHVVALPRRQRQTLDLLLRGDSEKQIAGKLGLSRHTVHVYVKSLHKRFNVSSRSELLARFIHANTHI